MQARAKTSGLYPMARDYLLPTALQLPMQNIVCCFFTLMIIFMTRRPAAAPAPVSS